MLFRQIGKTTKQLPKDVVQVPTLKGFTRMPKLGHIGSVYTAEHLQYGFSRACAKGANEDGLCHGSLMGEEFIYVSEAEMAKEFFTRNYHVGEVFAKGPFGGLFAPIFKPTFGNGLFFAEDGDKYDLRFLPFLRVFLATLPSSARIFRWLSCHVTCAGGGASHTES